MACGRLLEVWVKFAGPGGFTRKRTKEYEHSGPFLDFYRAAVRAGHPDPAQQKDFDGTALMQKVVEEHLPKILARPDESF